MSNDLSMTFKIYSGDELVREETLAQRVIKIGNRASNHLRIDDESVSRMHAVIEVSGPDEIYIMDLGAPAGTFVNGAKVNKSKLSSGDEITLGNTRVLFEVAGDAAEAGTEPLDEAPTTVAAGMTPSTPAPPGGVPNPFAKPSAPPAAAVPNPFAKPAAGGVPNPFAKPAAAAPATKTGPTKPEDITYGIVASGPPVAADEVESHESAVEVVVMWGDKSVLHVEHLAEGGFWVGESSKGESVNFLMGSDSLGGLSRMPVAVMQGGQAVALIPQGADGSVSVAGQTRSLQQLREKGNLQPSSILPGAEQYAVPPDAAVRVKFNEFTFVTKSTRAGKVIGGGFSVNDPTIFGYVGAVLTVAVAFLVILNFWPGNRGGLNFDVIDRDSRLIEYLAEARAEEEEEEEIIEENNANDNAGGKGKRHKGEEGAMGKKNAKKTNNRFGIEGPADNTDPHMAREQAREMATTAGVLGALSAITGSINAPTSPFGRDTALGNDPMSALGALMGDQIGENAGFGGLGLRGTGSGGGGTGEGTIGLGNLGTIGHGAGGGSGSGYGRGAGGFRGRRERVPQVRGGMAAVRGSLSREVIRRVVRRHIAEVRFCYEQQLNARPDLEGRVAVQFIIAPSGAVQTAAVASSSLSNAQVEQCIVRKVRTWSFPSPDGGGIVSVTYPFVLRQSN